MSDGPRINEAIRAASVRCIDPEGEQLGILNLDEALRKADKLASDDVCLILDKQAGHRYSEPELIEALLASIMDMHKKLTAGAD